jgi:hypothetical protein
MRNFASATPRRLPVTRQIGAAVAGFFRGDCRLSAPTAEDVERERNRGLRGSVTYTRHDRSTVTVPFANVFELRGERSPRTVSTSITRRSSPSA